MLAIKGVTARVGRVVVMTIGLVLAASVASPAVAQPGTSAFGFQFNYDRGGNNGDFRGIFGNDAPQLMMCLTDAQIRTSVARRGYTDIALNVANEPYIQVRATKDGSVYLLQFNFCTDRIESRNRLRSAN